MTGLAAILSCLAAAVEITVSPDQPLGFSYTDDPLIVEIRSDTAMTADVRLTLSPAAGGSTVQQEFPATILGPDVNRWCAMTSLPATRGLWDVAVTVRAESGESSHPAQVYRIDRPAGAFNHPLYAYSDRVDRDLLLALRSVAVEEIRIPAGHADIGKLLSEMDSMGMKAIVVLPDPAGAAAVAASLSETAGTAIARWELSATAENASAIPGAIEAFQGLPRGLPISIGIQGSGTAGAVLEHLGTLNTAHVVVHGGPEGSRIIETVRAAVSNPGNEFPAVEYIYNPAENGEFLQSFFEARARGASKVGFPGELIIADHRLQSGLAYLNGLAHGVAPSAYAGRLPESKGRHAYLFTEGDAWTLALWSDSATESLEFPWSSEAPVQLLDRWSNRQEISAPEGDAWNCTVTAEIQFLQGKGGPLLKEVLEAEVRADVKRLMARKDLAPVWTETVRNTLSAIGEAPISEQSRVHFFALLRALPDIEEHWHAGEITRPNAVAAISNLARLARTLCRLEAARGASFLEPIQDTLARCEEYQSRYLTGSTTTPQARARGDWLVEEVRRLMDEVESLLASGAKIEADAVAALAEWRARGLEFAAKAGPLSDQVALPEPEQPKEPAADEAPAKTSKGKKKK